MSDSDELDELEKDLDSLLLENQEFLIVLCIGTSVYLQRIHWFSKVYRFELG